MKNLLTAIAITLIAVSAYGFLVHRMRLSEIDEKRAYFIVVTDANADDRYAVVMVEGCSAEHTENNGVTCNLGWYGRTDREWPKGGKQTPVPFRDAPRGVLLRFEAVVTDRAGKHLASASLLTTRSFR